MEQETGTASIDAPPDPDSVRLSYQMLFARYQTAQSTVWTVVGATVAAEAGLWVGMYSVRRVPLVFGLGFLMLGVISPLAIRFLELSAMLDRQLMSSYEASLRIPTALRLEHGARLEERIALVTPRLRPADRDRFMKRRISKASTSLRRRRRWLFADKLLTALGQPSLVWTAVISMGAVAGAAASVALATSSGLWTGVCGALVFTALAAPWFLSAQKGPIARWRDSR